MQRAGLSFHERITRIVNDLTGLESDLRLSGDRQLASAVKRARRELEHKSVTGAFNTLGVDLAVRPEA